MQSSVRVGAYIKANRRESSFPKNYHYYNVVLWLMLQLMCIYLNDRLISVCECLLINEHTVFSGICT